MAGPVIIPDTAQFELQQTLSLQPCENVFHVHTDPAALLSWDTTRLTSFAQVFSTWWQTQLAPLVSSGTTLVQVRGRDIGTANGAEIVLTAGLPSNGNIATAVLPNHNTVAAAWRSGLSGRSNRGRTFVIGLCESQISGNQVTSTVLSALTAAFDNLRTTVGGHEVGGFTHLVIASRKLASTRIITQVTMNPEIDSQRRRLPGHNRHR